METPLAEARRALRLEPRNGLARRRFLLACERAGLGAEARVAELMTELPFGALEQTSVLRSELNESWPPPPGAPPDNESMAWIRPLFRLRRSLDALEKQHDYGLVLSGYGLPHRRLAAIVLGSAVLDLDQDELSERFEGPMMVLFRQASKETAELGAELFEALEVSARITLRRLTRP